MFTFATSLILASLLSYTQAGLIADSGIRYLSDEHAVAHTQQNVLRNFDGTVSHYAKSVATPYSSVHKQDTRISNNVYQPLKTVTYEPSHMAPIAYTPHAASSASPVYYTQHQPQTVYQHQPEPVYQHHQPAAVHSYSHQPQIQPVVAHYAHHAPALTHTVHYSPAESVSHMSFDGFGTHWGY